MNCTKNISRGCCFSRTIEGEAAAENLPGCHKMESWDWLADTPNPIANNQIYEVQFKNTRKGFYLNGTEMPLKKGDIVAVEASPGYDIGIVSLTGDLVARQMVRTCFNTQGLEFKKIFRKAKPYDIEKWQEAISMEHNTMIRSRQISADLGLKMKIGDVEYQGDRLKAIFYYIADERVDFRELIKILAEQFRIRIEMRQIGARQEAGRIGGISACGRELCCSTWQNSFSTVTIGAARHQEISLNPQKLAGQCGKLKCCLNYEVDTYIDARRDFPRLNAPLEAMDGAYHLVKSDIFRKIMWFSPDAFSSSIMIPLSVDRVRKIVAMNRKGIKVDKLEDVTLIKEVVSEPQFINVVGEESITRFDKSRGTNGSRRNGSRSGGQNGGRSGGQNGGDSSRTGGQENTSSIAAVVEAGGERGQSRNSQRNSDRNQSRNAQRNAERPSQGSAERNGERNSQSGSEERPSQGGSERNGARGMNRSSERNTERNTQGGGERNSLRGVNRSSERNGERNSQSGSEERPSQGGGERNAARGMNRSSERNNERRARGNGERNDQGNAPDATNQQFNSQANSSKAPDSNTEYTTGNSNGRSRDDSRAPRRDDRRSENRPQNATSERSQVASPEGRDSGAEAGDTPGAVERGANRRSGGGRNRNRVRSQSTDSLENKGGED